MGLESVATQELRQLGYTDMTTENGRIVLRGTATDVARLNLWMRTADRIKIVVGRFKAETFDELFEGTKALPWEAYLPFDAAFPVQGKSVRSVLTSVPDCQSIVKKAIVDRMSAKQIQFMSFDESGDTFPIEINVTKDWAEITLDTSGTGLHKRGYRLDQGEAPLKETLAAALVLLTNWKPHMPFIDPMCGSGTLAIEAAMIGLRLAPGFNRSFISERWPLIPTDVWEKAREEAEDLADYDTRLSIFASDIDHRMIETSQENALEAGLMSDIEFKQMQLADLTLPDENGVLVSNPPYGERMGDEKGTKAIAEQVGQLIQTRPDWSYYLITADKQFEKNAGQKATKKRKLFNGYLETQYYQFWASKHH
ncbi:class I SAM-dependent RNA methyltransferase [Bacillaceae bacterium SIJ1]|nr:class I SAM-dependent RNA methyltransferase [Litoribacterium kuwaitense]NGP43759.1 class I SAM-dependent RNA methyltransferase [Litoribacterium kuwaitense]